MLQLPIHQLHAQLVSGQISSVELTQATLTRIESHDSEINAYIAVDADRAMDQALLADARLASGEDVTPLTGIPIAIKDNINVAGFASTCGSRLFENNMRDNDATAVERLRAVGAVLIGKCNMDEMAMGSWSITSAYGPTRNPYEQDHAAGGSSGGSAAAVAALMAAASLGSDTGGSVRQPAALCGVVGLRPTYGRISRNGLYPSVESLDTIGPLTRDVTDAALLLGALAGWDELDRRSLVDDLEDLLPFRPVSVAGLRLGVPGDWLGEQIDREVQSAFESALRVFEDAGAGIEMIAFPPPTDLLDVYSAFSAQGAVREFGGRKRYSHLGAEVMRRVNEGDRLINGGDPERFDQMWPRRREIQGLFREFFEDGLDAILTPTTPTPALALSELSERVSTPGMDDRFTVPAVLADLPAISVPSGFSTQGLPIGLQLMTARLCEKELLKLAYWYEQERGPLPSPKDQR